MEYEVRGRSAKTGKPMKRPKKVSAINAEDAKMQAESAGMIPESVTPLNVRHLYRQVVGTHHKNADNTSRQLVIAQCRKGERIILAHETDNRHDKNAVRVLRQDGQQLGYLPSHIAAWVMEWFSPGAPLRYSAIISNMVGEDDYEGPELLLLLAHESASEDQIQSYLSNQRAEGALHDSKRAYPSQVLQSVPRQTMGKGKAAKDKPSGCLVLFAISAIWPTAVIVKCFVG